MVHKIKIVLALLVVFLLIFVTNKMDSNYFKILQEKFTSIYEDRLVVKDYLFKISRQLEQKKDFLASDNPQEFSVLNSNINDSIDVLLRKFSATRLTVLESQRLNALKDNIESLYSLEEKYYKMDSSEEKSELMHRINKRFDNIWDNMLVLSEIQLTEGKRLISSSNQVFKSTNLLTYLETGFLILISISFYLIFSYKPPAKNQD